MASWLATQPKGISVTLHTKHRKELVTLRLSTEVADLPRVLVWQWRTFVQDVGAGESPNYFETDNYFFW